MGRSLSRRVAAVGRVAVIYCTTARGPELQPDSLGGRSESYLLPELLLVILHRSGYDDLRVLPSIRRADLDLVVLVGPELVREEVVGQAMDERGGNVLDLADRAVYGVALQDADDLVVGFP